MSGFQSQVTTGIGNIGRALGSISGQVGRDLANVGRSLVTAAAVGGGVLATIGIRTAASLETAQLQFTTLLGSTEAAQQRVKELFDFARRTPFETGPIVQASRQLQVFGGNALASMDNLRRIGDAAAASAQPIEEVSFWVGRAYALIKAGQPFGEAAMRLQEMAILSGEARQKMEELQEAGAPAAEVFAVLSGELDRFAGATDLQADSIEGLISTIKDFKISIAQAMGPVVGLFKEVLTIIRDFANTPAWQAIIDNVSLLLAAFTAELQPAVDAFADALAHLSAADVDVFFHNLAGWIGDTAQVADELYQAFLPIMPLVAGLVTAFSSTALSRIPLIGLLIPQISGITGVLAGFTLGIKENREALFDFGEVLAAAGREALPFLGAARGDIMDSLSGAFQAALEGIQPGLEWLIREAAPELADALAGMAEPLADVAGAFGRLASAAIQELGPTFLMVARAVAALISGGLKLLGPILNFLASNIETLLPLLAGLSAALFTIRVRNLISDFGGLGGAIARLGQNARSEGGNIVRSMTHFDHWGNAAKKAGDEAKKAAPKVKDMTDQIQNAGTNAKVAATPITNVATAAKTTGDQAKQAVTPLRNTATAVKQVGDSVGDVSTRTGRFADTVNRTVDRLATGAEKSMARVGQAFRNLGGVEGAATQTSRTGDAINRAFASVASGAETMTNKVRTSVSSIASSVGSAAGGIAAAIGPELLIGGGIALATAKMEGLAQRQANVRAGARELAREIERTGDAAKASAEHIEAMMNEFQFGGRDAIGGLEKVSNFIGRNFTFGLAGSPLVNAVTSFSDAFRDPDMARGAEALRDALDELGLGAEDLQEKLQLDKWPFEEFKTQLAETAAVGPDEFKDLVAVLETMRAEVGLGVTQVDRMKAAQEGAAIAAQGHIDKLQGLREQLGNLQDVQLAFAQSGDRVIQAQKDLSAALEQLAGEDIQGTSDAALAARQAIYSNVDAIQAFKQGMIDSGASSEEMNAKLQPMYDTLVQSLLPAFGDNTEAVQHYLETLGLVPPSVDTEITAA